MAYLRRVTARNGTYYYVVESARRGDDVSKKVLEYLGLEPDAETIARAARYWRVREDAVQERPGRRTVSIKSASPTTQGWADRLRKDLRQFSSEETKHYVKFVNERTKRIFAWINPLKRYARLFLLLDPAAGRDLR